MYPAIARPAVAPESDQLTSVNLPESISFCTKEGIPSPAFTLASKSASAARAADSRAIVSSILAAGTITTPSSSPSTMSPASTATPPNVAANVAGRSRAEEGDRPSHLLRLRLARQGNTGEVDRSIRHHWRVHRCWRDAVDQYAVRRRTTGQPLDDSVNAALRSDVVRPGDQATRSTGEGADEHYAPPSPADHPLQEHAGQVHRPEDIYRHHAIEIGIPVQIVPVVIPRTDS